MTQHLRIDRRFSALRQEGRKALVTFVTAGDPDYATSEKILLGLPAAGADLIELGMPFSDPMADGPVLQRAAGRAIRAGTSLSRVLEMVATERRSLPVPIVLFGYYNPFFRYGVEAVARDAKAAGVDGFLCVDLPPEESADLAAEQRLPEEQPVCHSCHRRPGIDRVDLQSASLQRPCSIDHRL
jgi:tryptophan synthase alpha chain